MGPLYFCTNLPLRARSVQKDFGPIFLRKDLALGYQGLSDIHFIGPVLWDGFMILTSMNHVKVSIIFLVRNTVIQNDNFEIKRNLILE